MKKLYNFEVVFRGMLLECLTIHQFLDQQYLAVLNEPVPMLDDMTPRKAARSKKGREKLVAWLKYLENRTARAGDDSPMATYDFTWMWEELGVAKLR